VHEQEGVERELVWKDMFYFDAAGVDLQGYDACFFVLGVSSVGMNEYDYRFRNCRRRGRLPMSMRRHERRPIRL
jgi:hypothetical protein